MTQNTLGLEEYKRAVKVRKKASKAEENLQLQICEYIKLKYPHVIFMCDLASGMKMPIWLAARNKKMRSSSGLPDLFIAFQKTVAHGYPVRIGDDDDGVLRRYCGLFIELKKSGTKLYKKDDKTPATPHLANQASVLGQLSEQGYAACFCVGFEEAKNVIDEYLK